MPPNRTGRSWRHSLEYAAIVALLALLRWLPRRVARFVGATLARLACLLHRRWRRVAELNLNLAFPALSETERRRIVRGAFRQVGWLLAEFARFPRHTRESIEEVIVYDGLENYQQAAARGKGVLYLTAHLGAWEFSSFSHSLHGYPLAYLNRPLDNPRLDALVNRYRSLGGNRALDRRHAARRILEHLRTGGAVGILVDQNVVDGDGNVFVDFFGLPASTTAGLARIALRTNAAVVPAFVLWDEPRGKYRLRFDPALELVRTGDAEHDVVENTARFNRVLEDYIRRYPDQWLWFHRRWATRPPGVPPLYPF
ncbi:MAG: lysophospholipid acyltransferase family protein [Terriglobia bacterium]